MIETIAPGDPRRTLWDSLPTKVFIDLAELESFRSNHTSVLLKIRNGLSSMPLSAKMLGALPFGRLALITCGDVPIAYEIDAPNCKKMVGRNYAALLLRGTPPVEIRRLFIDGTLIVLGDDTAMVATTPTNHWIKGKE